MSQLVYLKDSHATISTLSVVVADDYPILRSSRMLLGVTDSIAALTAAAPLDTISFSSTTMTTVLVDTRQVVHTISDTTPSNPSYKTAFTNGTWLDTEITLLDTLLKAILQLHSEFPLTSLSYTTP
jgi:hypothetical protein